MCSYFIAQVWNEEPFFTADFLTGENGISRKWILPDQSCATLLVVGTVVIGHRPRALRGLFIVVFVFIAGTRATGHWERRHDEENSSPYFGRQTVQTMGPTSLVPFKKGHSATVFDIDSMSDEMWTITFLHDKKMIEDVGPHFNHNEFLVSIILQPGNADRK